MSECSILTSSLCILGAYFSMHCMMYMSSASVQMHICPELLQYISSRVTCKETISNKVG